MSEEGGYHVQRAWRGVTDHHMIEPGFLTSAEARKLARLVAEHADVYTGIARLVRASAAASEPEAAGTDGEEAPPPPRAEAKDGAITRLRNCSKRFWPMAARACRSSATRALAR
jgi:DNA gyrase subunit B